MTSISQEIAHEFRKNFAGILCEHPACGSKQLLIGGLESGQILRVPAYALNRLKTPAYSCCSEPDQSCGARVLGFVGPERWFFL